MGSASLASDHVRFNVVTSLNDSAATSDSWLSAEVITRKKRPLIKSSGVHVHSTGDTTLPSDTSQRMVFRFSHTNWRPYEVNLLPEM
ncbi:hypothetical protein BaRGS_00032882 [Batillaria attramentaria]|uniref:Uncharacterized protein n=1 Tax=Batillaria attramentaria TaxID=370345 RepID=A0ABD0JMW0_9CAEN